MDERSGVFTLCSRPQEREERSLGGLIKERRRLEVLFEPGFVLHSFEAETPSKQSQQSARSSSSHKFWASPSGHPYATSAYFNHPIVPCIKWHAIWAF